MKISRLLQTVARAVEADSPAKLKLAYEHAKEAVLHLPLAKRVNPRAVFTNNELNLRKIGVFGFDYDYTLAVYTKKLNDLVYSLAVSRLVNELKYPVELLHTPYDTDFAIRGLHYDIHNNVLLKVNAFNQIQTGTAYRGFKKLSKFEAHKLYKNFSIPEATDQEFHQLIDLFSLPFAGMLTTVVDYFDKHGIAFDPVSLYSDVQESVRRVHVTGEMYSHVSSNLETYIHKNDGLREYLEMLVADGKELFMITNSPFSFMNTGMTYMLGKDWRDFFKYIVVSARKPSFFRGNMPFRLYNEKTDGYAYDKVSTFSPHRIYAGGNIRSFWERAEFKSNGVLYFGDHIYTDLAEPMLKLGWHTAAIVPELAREIRVQNQESYRTTVIWMETITQLIEKYQRFGDVDAECNEVIKTWAAERREIKQGLKANFNKQFGSMFRTYHSMTYFYRRLNRLADIYTSRLPNLLPYGTSYTFFPRRNPLPHESEVQVVEHADEIVSGI